MVDAAVRRFPHLRHDVGVGGEERIRRAHAAGGLQLRFVDVDRQHPARAARHRAQKRREADAAEADHRHGLAGPHLTGVHHGSDAGHHRAAEERGLHQRDVLADFHDGAARDDGIFREGADPAMMVERRAVVTGDAARPGEQRARAVGGGAAQAERGPALLAIGALPADRLEGHDHMVAGREIRDAWPELRHHAGGFVPERDGHRARAVAVDSGEIRMADAGRRDLDEHLAGAGLRQAHRLDRERARLGIGPRQTGLPQHRRTNTHHGVSPAQTEAVPPAFGPGLARFAGAVDRRSARHQRPGATFRSSILRV